jgi:hypothetical protein
MAGTDQCRIVNFVSRGQTGANRAEYVCACQPVDSHSWRRLTRPAPYQWLQS